MPSLLSYWLSWIDWLVDLLTLQGLRPPVLVFVQSKERAQQLYMEIRNFNPRVDVIHADRSPAQVISYLKTWEEHLSSTRFRGSSITVCLLCVLPLSSFFLSQVVGFIVIIFTPAIAIFPIVVWLFYCDWRRDQLRLTVFGLAQHGSW